MSVNTMSDPLEQLDYYSLLQVPRDANSDQVRNAFHAFAARYHPDKFQGSGAEDRKVERAAQIYRRGAEAYRVLCNPRQRKQYDQGLHEGRVRFDANAAPPAQAPVVGQWPIKVKTPLARPFAIKAEQLYKSGDFGNCKTNLKLALQKDKGNAQIELLLKDVEARMAGSDGADTKVVPAAVAEAAAKPNAFASEPPTGPRARAPTK
jgi:curved DNA-binding protein CbpA